MMNTKKEIENDSDDFKKPKFRRSISERLQQILDDSFFQSKNKIDNDNIIIATESRSKLESSKSVGRLSQSRLAPFNSKSSTQSVPLETASKEQDNTNAVNVDQNNNIKDYNITNSQSKLTHEVETLAEEKPDIDSIVFDKDTSLGCNYIEGSFEKESNISVITSISSNTKRRKSIIERIMNKFKRKHHHSDNSSPDKNRPSSYDSSTTQTYNNSYLQQDLESPSMNNKTVESSSLNSNCLTNSIIHDQFDSLKEIVTDSDQFRINLTEENKDGNNAAILSPDDINFITISPNEKIHIGELVIEKYKQMNDLNPDEVHENNIEIDYIESSPTNLTIQPPLILTTVTIPKKLYRIHGIRDKLFTENEIRKLSILPHCKYAILSEEETSINKVDGYYRQEHCEEEHHDVVHDVIPSDYIYTPIEKRDDTDIATYRLDLSSKIIENVNFEDYQINSRTTETIILRNNKLKSIYDLNLQDIFRSLIELDVAHNCIAGQIYYQNLPFGLLRLDLSYNQITDIDGIIACLNLVELNLSHNKIDRVAPLPATLLRLDLSHNLLWKRNTIRIISLCSDLISLNLDSNPLTCLYSKWKTTARSCLTRVRYYDARKLPNDNIHKHVSFQSSSPTEKARSNALSISTSSSPSRNNSPIKSRTTPSKKASIKEQIRNDELRSERHFSKLDNIKEMQLLKEYERNLRFSSHHIQISENEAQELSNRLCIPKYTSPAKNIYRKKTTFGNATRNLLIPNSSASSPSRNSNNLEDILSYDKKLVIPIEEAIELVKDWINNAKNISKQAVKLIKKIKLTSKKSDIFNLNSLELRSLINNFETSKSEISFDICEPVPMKVKLAMNTLHIKQISFKVDDVQHSSDVVTKLRRKLKYYKSMLQQLEHALLLLSSSNNKAAFSFIINIIFDSKRDIDDPYKVEDFSQASKIFHTISESSIITHDTDESFVQNTTDNHYDSDPEQADNINDDIDDHIINDDNIDDETKHDVRSKMFETLSRVSEGNETMETLSIKSDWSGRGDWMARILLGEAAVLLNTVLDLASISTVTKRSLDMFRSERERLTYSVQLEKYPKAFESLMQNTEFRIKLVNFDNLFTEIDNVLQDCVQYPEKSIRTEIDKVMRTELGQLVNESAFNIYEY